MAVAAVAALAPAVLLSEDAWAQTDESLGTFDPNATLVFRDDGNSTAGAYTNATYFSSIGLASGDDGRLIVSDTFNHRVVVFDNGYKFSFAIGAIDPTTGRPASGDGNGEFNRPTGVAVNSTGHIFVADSRNDRIQIFSSDGTFVRMFNQSSSEMPTKSVRDDSANIVGNDVSDFTGVIDVAVSHDEKLIYVTVESHAVYHFNASTYKYVNKTGNRNSVDQVPVSVGIDTRSTEEQRLVLQSVNVDPRADGFGHTHVVEVKGQFHSVRGIDVGPGGLLAVAEEGRYVVNVIDPATAEPQVVPGTEGVNGSASTRPMVSFNNTVFLIGATPLPNGAGKPGAEEGQFGSTPPLAASSPRDVAFSKDGSLLAVADPGNYRFQVFQLNTTDDGRATGLLHPDGKPAYVIGVPRTHAHINTLAVAFDYEGRLVLTRSGASTGQLEVYNVTLPAVKNVTAKVSSGDGVDSTVLVPGGSIIVDVRFNTNLVKVNTTGGMPYMAIGPEHIATFVPYENGETTDTLTFRYDVKEGDMPAHFVYDPKTALTLNGSAITAGMRNVIALTDLSNLDGATYSLLSDHGITVDAVGPKLVNVYSPNASAAYQAGDRIEIVLNYSEPAIVVGPAPTLALDVDTVDGGDRFASYFRGNETAMLEFNYTVQKGDRTASGGLRYASADALGLDGIQIQDRYGNPARPLPPPAPLVDITGAAVDIAVDAMPPRVTSVSPETDGVYGAGDTVGIAVVFDEPVNATGSPTLALATDPPRSAMYVDGSDGDASLMFRYVVEAGDAALGGLQYSGTDALRAGGGMIVDAAGNPANLTLRAPDTPGYSLAGIIVNASTMMAVPNQTDPGNQTGTPDTGGQGGAGQNATLTCSIALGQSISDMDVRPGERSTEASQTVMNSGTAPFMAVMLEAMPWYVDLSANTTLAAVQGMDPAPEMLPASLTEVRLGNGTDAMYAALPENGTAAVVGALAPGADYPLSFMLDLTDQTSAPGQTMTQFIEYTAECAAP